MSNSYQNCMKCGYRLEKLILADGQKSYKCPYCSKYNSGSGLRKDLCLDDFVLIEKLGSGSMGEVWKAKQQSMNRDVALKILSPELSGDEEFVRRFLNEAEMTGRLQHPNIITAYTAGNSGDYYYLATLFVDGIELQDKIHIDGMIPEREALNIARVIASALCYAWEQHQMLHCDVKPGNIMIDRYRVPYLMDMGISKIVSESDHLNQFSLLSGSPQYMSPEQATGDVKLDFRTDIYSLGVTLYQMVTASLPFDSRTIATVIESRNEKGFSKPTSRNPYLTEGCSDMIVKMMSFDREERQSDWNYVISDIDAVIAGRYSSEKRVRVKKWDEIKAVSKAQLNRPINLGWKKKDKNPIPESEFSTDTRKISMEKADGNENMESKTEFRPPPVIFDGSKDRKSGLKLLILLIILLLVSIGAIINYALKFFK